MNRESAEKEPVKFFELADTGEDNPRTPSAVENYIRHLDGVTFFGLTEVDGKGDELEDEDARSSTVMVVEDDNIVSTMLKHLLERRGYRIDIASDGRGAEEMIESKIPPALVILDVMLPFVDGFELLRRIREHESWERVPVIMLTAKTREEDIVRALESGADDYIVKPFQPQELVARVKRFVRR